MSIEPREEDGVTFVGKHAVRQIGVGIWNWKVFRGHYEIALSPTKEIAILVATALEEKEASSG